MNVPFPFLAVGMLFMALLSSCHRSDTLFEAVDADHSGIHFNNKFVENDSINPIDVTNIYNGGGVGVGDFNGDGLQDLYFTGNLVVNKMYLNKGDMQFDDVTAKDPKMGQRTYLG